MGSVELKIQLSLSVAIAYAIYYQINSCHLQPLKINRRLVICLSLSGTDAQQPQRIMKQANNTTLLTVNDTLKRFILKRCMIKKFVKLNAGLL